VTWIERAREFVAADVARLIFQNGMREKARREHENGQA